MWKIWDGAAAPGPAVTRTSSTKPISVTIGTAPRQNVPVYLTGLGTVQAFNTVTVNTRVDGELEKVDFTEGQNVKVGDALAQIDPRPFQASLALAQASKAKDEAQLANARIDLQRYQKAPLGTTQQQIDTQAALVQQLVATVQADQANIDSAQVQLNYTTIKAPLSGRTGVRLVDQAISSTRRAQLKLWLSRSYSRYRFSADHLAQMIPNPGLVDLNRLAHRLHRHEGPTPLSVRPRQHDHQPPAHRRAPVRTE